LRPSRRSRDLASSFRPATNAVAVAAVAATPAAARPAAPAAATPVPIAAIFAGFGPPDPPPVDPHPEQNCDGTHSVENLKSRRRKGIRIQFKRFKVPDTIFFLFHDDATQTNICHFFF
jgi:hypothetical protein